MIGHGAPKVSVVLAVYNGARYVSEAIESVLGQTYRDFELIVVDDGSTDETPTMIERFGDAIKVIRQPNRGMAAARNTGIWTARGSYIGFQDHDDLWVPEKLAIQVPRLEADPEIGLLYADMANLMPDGSTGPRRLREHDVSRLSGWVFDYMLLWWLVGGPTALVPRRVFEAVGGFDESFRYCCSDWDMWLRVTRRFKVCYVDAMLAWYRQHETNRTRLAGNDLIVREQMRILDKVYSDETAPPSAWAVRRRAYAHVWYKAGRDVAAAKGGAAACRMLANALRHDPFFPSPWMALARVAIGRPLTSWLRGGSPGLRDSQGQISSESSHESSSDASPFRGGGKG